MAQWYCMVNGQRFGPASEEEVHAWVKEGRAGPGDLVWTEGMSDWVAVERSPFGSGAPADAPPPLPGGSTTYQKPHRGTTVLVLGILGLVVCCICGIVAWSMGAEDLKHMDAGLMDPSGREQTKAGKICGMISVILAIVGGGIWLLFVLFGMGSAAFMG